jgi:hypothetical protein
LLRSSSLSVTNGLTSASLSTGILTATPATLGALSSSEISTGSFTTAGALTAASISGATLSSGSLITNALQISAIQITGPITAAALSTGAMTAATFSASTQLTATSLTATTLTSTSLSTVALAFSSLSANAITAANFFVSGTVSVGVTTLTQLAVTVNQNSDGVVTASCPTGTRIVSAGYQTDAASWPATGRVLVTRVEFLSESGGASGVLVAIDNNLPPGDNKAAITAYGLCARMI